MENYRFKASEAGSIVCTIAVGIVYTNFSRLICCFLKVPQTPKIKASACSSIVEQKFYGLFEQKKNHKAVAMVRTLLRDLTLTILQAQSIRTGSIVLTNALGIVLTILQAQSIRRLNCLDKSFLPCHDKSAALILNGLNSRNYCPAISRNLRSRLSCLNIVWQVSPHTKRAGETATHHLGKRPEPK